ncbi:MAG TPA: hypothetical protein VI522_04060, partial [Gammaproteobacteria bacterium]|nr:hypothetical protein [Gammaproteobacteria bacterium]
MSPKPTLSSIINDENSPGNISQTPTQKRKKRELDYTIVLETPERKQGLNNAGQLALAAQRNAGETAISNHVEGPAKKHKTSFDGATPQMQLKFMQTTMQSIYGTRPDQAELKRAIDQFIELCNDEDLIVYLGLEALPAEASKDDYNDLAQLYKTLYQKNLEQGLNYKLEGLQAAVKPLILNDVSTFGSTDLQSHYH